MRTTMAHRYTITAVLRSEIEAQDTIREMVEAAQDVPVSPRDDRAVQAFYLRLQMEHRVAYARRVDLEQQLADLVSGGLALDAFTYFHMRDARAYRREQARIRRVERAMSKAVRALAAKQRRMKARAAFVISSCPALPEMAVAE